MLALPRPHDCFKVLIAADNAACEGNVHTDSDRVGTVETTESLVPQNVPHTLRRCQVLAKLKPLFDH